MTLTAMVEKLEDRRYRAVIVQPFAIESEGETEEEAVDRLREMEIAKLKSHKVVEIQMPGEPVENPWVKLAGMFKDHPDFDRYLMDIEEYRREIKQAEQP